MRVIGYDSLAYKLLSTVFDVFSSIHWSKLKGFFNNGKYWDLTFQDREIVRALLKPNYYVILTRRKTHLTTYLIAFASWVATGKFAHYAHALMNVDDGNIVNDEDFKLMEAIKRGVQFSSFSEVFDCDSVALLRPKGFTSTDWVAALDALLLQEGKEYDDLFNLADESRLSCVELVRLALKRAGVYEQNFKALENLIVRYGRSLTPQMLYDCGCFEVAFEARR